MTLTLAPAAATITINLHAARNIANILFSSELSDSQIDERKNYWVSESHRSIEGGCLLPEHMFIIE